MKRWTACPGQQSESMPTINASTDNRLFPTASNFQTNDRLWSLGTLAMFCVGLCQGVLAEMSPSLKG